MDADVRAELDALRRRAYGPDADIQRDPEAMARLAVLEHALHRDAHDPPASPGDGRTPDAADARARASVTAGDSGRDLPVARRRSRRGWMLAGGAAVAAAVAVIVSMTANAPASDPVITALDGPSSGVHEVSARQAYSLARDFETTVLLRIPLDGSFGNYIDLPLSPSVPEFPASGPLSWASPLGTYYGWELWIGGAKGALQNEHCILARRDAQAIGRCVPATLRAQSALVVPLSYADVVASERPEGLEPTTRIGFWWYQDREVTVLLGAEIPEP
ncbi:hypothetical protein GCM10022200_23240 [Microbacterium awajiense]|uniref:DUF1707 domain-containing protein n=1 Tax=Microbacterium awajiense TaxID=415214 RepID=A0ABP7ASU2_9MICO